MSSRIYKPEDPMYIEIHSYEDTVIWKSPHHDATVSDMFNNFIGLLTTLGFMPKSIDNYIVEKAEEINSREEDYCEAV